MTAEVSRFVFVSDDRSIGIDNEFLLEIPEEYFDWVPKDIHAVQWYGSEHGGEIEYRQETPFSIKPQNQRFAELGEWQALVDLFYEEKQRREDAEKLRLELIEASIDYLKEFKSIRDYKLLESDWTQLPDVVLSEEKVNEWRIYRQQLRDLPLLVDDPKPIVIAFNNNEIHPIWPIPPQ